MKWDLNSFEEQIVKAAAVGLEDDDIAEIIGSTGAEVKRVLDRVMKDLGLASRLELILFVHWQHSAENMFVA